MSTSPFAPAGETDPLQVRVLDTDFADLRPGDPLTLPNDTGSEVHLTAAADGPLVRAQRK